MANEKNLKEIKVRFTPETLARLDTVAQENHTSRAEIIRYAVDNRLSEHLSQIRYIDRAQGKLFTTLLRKLVAEICDIKVQLRRIGINYNQQIRLEQIEKKYKNADSVLAFQHKINEMNKVRKMVYLDKAELEHLMQRYEAACQKVGDLICHIAG